MPTATPFTALGRGNGFPFCPPRVDVDTYDYWTTLGGFKKTDGGSPSQAQIDLSLTNAMKLYWNLWKVSGSAEADNQGTTYGPINHLVEDVDATDVTSPSGVDELFPNLRTCLNSYTLKKEEKTPQADDGAFPATAYLQVRLFICRMYNGGEFVGYGIDSRSGWGNIIGSASIEIISAFVLSALVTLNSFSNDGNADYEEIDYKNINGMDFVVRCYAFSDGYPSGTFVKDIPNLTASVIPEVPSDGKVEVKLDTDPLSFYTY